MAKKKYLPTQWHFANSYVRRTEFPLFGTGATLWTIMTIFLSELFGTGTLMYLGCMSILLGFNHFTICFAFGLVVMLVLQSLGPVSVGHINPSVTVSAVILGKITWAMGIVYFLAECFGAYIGYALLLIMTPFDMRVNPKTHIGRTCCTLQHASLNALQSVAAEFLVTGILIYVLCASWDKRNAARHDSLVIKFGLAITVLALAGGPYTGASMNPARSLAPALLHNVWTRHWIYWVGPLSASILVTVFYRLIFDNPMPMPMPEDKQGKTPTASTSKLTVAQQAPSQA